MAGNDGTLGNSQKTPRLTRMLLPILMGAISLAGPQHAEGQMAPVYPIDELGLQEAIDYVQKESIPVLLTYGEAMEVKGKPRTLFRWVAKRHKGHSLVGFTLNRKGREIGWWWEVEQSPKLVRLVNGSEELAQKYELSIVGVTPAGEVILAQPDDSSSLLEGQAASELTDLVRREQALVLLTYKELIDKKVRGIKELQELVRVLYNCPQGCTELVAKLEGIVKPLDNVVVAPDSGTKKRITLVSYTHETDQFDEFDEPRILQFVRRHTNRWRAEERGNLYLVSFTYELEPGLVAGWWWEEEPLGRRIRLVNGNEALAKKYDLFKAGTSPDGDELLGRWEVAKGTYVPVIRSRHTLLGAPIQPPYNSDPPTSGPHTFNPAKWGIHREPIPREVQVRNLEAGGILVQYNCPEGCSELVAKLEGVVKRFEGKKVILAPYPGMDQRIALTAWQRLDKLSEFDEERIVAFINAYLSFDRHDPE